MWSNRQRWLNVQKGRKLTPIRVKKCLKIFQMYTSRFVFFNLWIFNTEFSFVYIRSIANQQIVGAKNGGRIVLAEDQNDAEHETEHFIIQKEDNDNEISIEARANSKFVCLDTEHQLIARCDYKNREIFKVSDRKRMIEDFGLPDGISLQSTTTGHYVSVVSYRNWTLAATSYSAGVWELFTAVPYFYGQNEGRCDFDSFYGLKFKQK